MEWHPSEDCNDERAERSIVWLLGWAMVLPFAHPVRLLAYGFIPLALLIGLTVLFPGASILAPVLITPSFALRVPTEIMPFRSSVAAAILLLTFLMTAFLLCTWQRDIVRRFRDPIGQLVIESAACFIGYLAASMLFVIYLMVAFLALGFMKITSPGQASSGLVGVASLFGLLLLTPLYARVAFVGPLIAHRGWKGALRRAWKFSEGRTLGSLLVFAMLGLFWMVMLGLSDVLAIRSITTTKDSNGLLIANCINVSATLITLLWLTAVPATTVRRWLARETTEAAAFD